MTAPTPVGPSPDEADRRTDRRVAPRYFTIVNGAAGGGRCRSRADLCLSQLERAGFHLEIRLTDGAGHATELAREAWNEGHRQFLVVGGDGTSYEVLNGLLPRAAGDDVPVLGLLPLGTGNSFLRDFHIHDTDAALHALRHGTRRPVDAVRIEHEDGEDLFYMNILGLGLTATAGAMTNDHLKPLGTTGYILAVVAKVASLDTPCDPLTIDGGEVDSRSSVFLSFCNSKFTGGSMMMAPQADPTDGKLDVIRAGTMTRGRLLGAFPRIFQGTHVTLPEVEETQARRIDFEEPRAQPVMIDGEIRYLTVRALEVVPGAVEVVL